MVTWIVPAMKISSRKLVWAVFCLFLAQGQSQAVIKSDVALKAVLEDQPIIFMAKVQKIHTDKPVVVVKFAENLKGKAPFEELRVNLAGDSEGKRLKDPEALRKRLAENLPLVIFAKKSREWQAFGFTNGTWFQMTCKDPARYPWVFTHCEPFLHRTFAGSTADLRQVILDSLAGKKPPPPVDQKAKPGLGPEVPARQGARNTSGPAFAVIPTVALGGPLAILAMLFPTLFGKPREIFQRYLALLTVTTAISILYLLHEWFLGSIQESWWGSPLALWLGFAALAAMGLFWAWRRYHVMTANGDTAVLVPRRGEEIILKLLSLSGLMLVPYCLGRGTLLLAPWKELLIMWVVVWAGTLGLAWLHFRARKQPTPPATVPLEGIMLGGLGLACLGLAATALPAQAAAETVQETNHVALAWTFKPEGFGKFDSTPLVTEDRVWIAGNQLGLSGSGILYCIDRATGKPLWSFDDEGGMKPAFSSPCLADGKLYLGEGYHKDADCKLYCLDASTGKKLWDYQTSSHTESSPCVADGKVYFGAGNDGVYCLRADTGDVLWHYTGLHVDTSPAVAGNRLYAGSGYGKQYFVFSLDTHDGKEIWKREVKLPVFGSPTVVGQQVFFGMGNGDLVKSDPQPAGALLCLDAATGDLPWKPFEVADAVHGRPAADARCVWFGSRDGHVYCLDRLTGKQNWKLDLGSPVVGQPALIACSACGRSHTLYALASAGKLCCLDPEKGAVHWTYQIAPASLPTVLSSPRLRQGKDGKRRLYFGAGLGDVGATRAALFSLEDLWTK